MTMTAEEVMKSFEEKFEGHITDIKLDNYEGGVKKVTTPHLWVRVKRDKFHDAVKHLSQLGMIHNCVASGSDKGDNIEILYHMSIFYTEPNNEVTVTIGLSIPKEDPHYPTITDIVPGAVPTEREKQEFLGVVVDGIPDNRKMWLLESDLPDDVYPWRKDENGPEDYINDVYKKDKPADEQNQTTNEEGGD